MKIRKQLSVCLLVCMLVTLTLAGCGGTSQEKEAEQSLKVAIVFPGAVNDEGFNQAGYEGLKMIEEQLGAEIAYSENTTVASFVQVYRDFADQGYNVIIGNGFEFGDVALEVAPDYPDVKFIVGSNPVVEAENVAGITGKSWEAAYLCGVVAGLMTETGKIGGIAGFDFPILVAQMEAYKMGAQSVRPDVEVTTVYVGSFEDVSKAKEATLAQASAGVDVVYHIADAAGIGVIQACEEAGIWAIGWGLDQNHLGPDTVVTSMLFSGAELLLKDVELVANGEWTGAVRLYGLDTGVVGLADFHGLVPDEIAEQVEQARGDIIAGKIEVPYLTERTD